MHGSRHGYSCRYGGALTSDVRALSAVMAVNVVHRRTLPSLERYSTLWYKMRNTSWGAAGGTMWVKPRCQAGNRRGLLEETRDGSLPAAISITTSVRSRSSFRNGQNAAGRRSPRWSPGALCACLTPPEIGLKCEQTLLKRV
jgi:hypothetical protein